MTERLEVARERVRAHRARTTTRRRLDARALRDAWPSLPVGDRRALARAYVARVVIDPARVRGSNRFDVTRVRPPEWRP